MNAIPSTPSDNTRKKTCKCPYCGGHFLISPEMADSQLICPHCTRQLPESVAAEAESEEPEHEDSGKLNLPPNKKEKFVAKKKAVSVAKPSNLLKFDDKVQSFEAVPEQLSRDKKRLKQFDKKQDRNLLNFFFLLGAVCMFGISIVIWYKTIQLPSLDSLRSESVDLFVDKESERYEQFVAPGFTLTNDDIIKGDDTQPDNDSPAHKLDSNIFQHDELENILETMQKFASAATDEERLQYVFAPEDTLEPMKVQTARDAKASKAYPLPTQILNAKKTDSSVIVQLAMNDSSVKAGILIKDEKGKWRLDWFSWVPYQEMTYDELMEKSPTHPVTVRVMPGITANYEAPFLEKPSDINYEGRTYASVELRFDNNNSLRGYVDRNSETASSLIKDSMMGSQPKTLKIKFPAQDSEAAPDQVIIESYVRPNWLGDKADEVHKNEKDYSRL